MVIWQATGRHTHHFHVIDSFPFDTQGSCRVAPKNNQVFFQGFQGSKQFVPIWDLVKDKELVNNLLLISMCILRDLPQHKKNQPQGVMPRDLPPILYVPTFPWKCFFSTKWERSQEIKRELVCVKGRFQYSCVLLRFGNTLRLMPLGCPSLRKQSRVFFFSFFLSFVQFCDVGYS